ncbi:MAG: phage holin family protein [Deltaproteobacteria bacterium]|nr:phage holin family protein [Deltaproteobacteria bacterium]
MMIVIRWVILTLAVLIVSYILDGIRVDNVLSAFFASAVLGILNVSLRPVLLILTLPINILTLGLLTFLINALMLKIASEIMPGFEVHGFWTAVFGALLISIVAWFLNSFTKARNR